MGCGAIVKAGLKIILPFGTPEGPFIYLSEPPGGALELSFLVVAPLEVLKQGSSPYWGLFSFFGKVVHSLSFQIRLVPNLSRGMTLLI